MKVALAVVADLVLALALSAAQFLVFLQIWWPLVYNHDAFRIGSPFTLMLGPALYVLFRRGKKSKYRVLAGRVLGIIISIVYISPALSIGGGIPGIDEIVMTGLILMGPGAVEAVILWATEHFMKKAWRSRQTQFKERK